MTNKYFAEIDSDSIVIRVVSAESKDQCESNYGGAWVETWKDGSQRFHFACVGSPYNERLDAFVPNNDFQGWILNEETIEWEPPTPMPEPQWAIYISGVMSVKTGNLNPKYQKVKFRFDSARMSPCLKWKLSI